MKLTLPAIHHEREGFAALIDVDVQTERCEFEDVEIDMAQTNWFDADMCATFGAILYRLGRRLNVVRLLNVPSNVEAILSRNGFLSSYGRAQLPDRYGTTIPYQRFDVRDDRHFADYVDREFVRRPNMPKMSEGLLKKFRESVFEIFSNAVIHSQSRLGIFSCGQYFHKRHRIVFSVADLGVGIRENVRLHAGRDLGADAAILWAVDGRNTTKRGPVPGGLGLKLLREFITLNGGRIQIVSDRGYWHLTLGQVGTAVFSHCFPGTVVTIEINAADTQSYRLTSEISETDIF